MVESTIVVLTAVVIYQWIDKQITVNRLERANHTLCEQWVAERKDLLDRIQAPTFQEYTNKVIREKKAEQPEEPKTNYDEYVS